MQINIINLAKLGNSLNKSPTVKVEEKEKKTNSVKPSCAFVKTNIISLFAVFKNYKLLVPTHPHNTPIYRYG